MRFRYNINFWHQRFRNRGHTNMHSLVHTVLEQQEFDSSSSVYEVGSASKNGRVLFMFQHIQNSSFQGANISA